VTSSPHSDPHSSPREFTQVEIEQPLHDYIDMEAYDVVAGQTYRDLVEQLETLRGEVRRAQASVALEFYAGSRSRTAEILRSALNPAREPS
jgi:hypothetical protein